MEGVCIIHQCTVDTTKYSNNDSYKHTLIKCICSLKLEIDMSMYCSPGIEFFIKFN